MLSILCCGLPLVIAIIVAERVFTPSAYIRHYWKVFTRKQIYLRFPFSNASFDGNYGGHTQLRVLYLQFLSVYSEKHPSQCGIASRQQAHAQRRFLNLTSPD